jgi:hypothetical protein
MCHLCVDLKDDCILVCERERVSNYVANGSKTAAMDIIGFLCGSLGSSIVQLHGSLGSGCASSCSEAGFCSQNGDRT